MPLSPSGSGLYILCVRGSRPTKNPASTICSLKTICIGPAKVCQAGAGKLERSFILFICIYYPLCNDAKLLENCQSSPLNKVAASKEYHVISFCFLDKLDASYQKAENRGDRGGNTWLRAVMKGLKTGNRRRLNSHLFIISKHYWGNESQNKPAWTD